MKRSIAIALGLVPLAVILFCLLSPIRVPGSTASTVGWGLFALGGLICLGNGYLSWVRPWLRRRRASEEGESVSGIPLLGSLMVTVSLLLLPATLPLTLTGLVLLILDTGGWHWFVISTWADKDLWKRSGTEPPRTSA